MSLRLHLPPPHAELSNSGQAGTSVPHQRAGHGDYVVNADALAYMRKRNLAGPVTTAAAPQRPGLGTAGCCSGATTAAG